MFVGRSRLGMPLLMEHQPIRWQKRQPGNVHSIERKDCGVRNDLHRLKATNMFHVKVVKIQSIFEYCRHVNVHGHNVIPNG
jgi:hypothetical protein